MKKQYILLIILSLLLSIVIVLGMPLIRKDNAEISADINNEKSLVSQEILSYDTKEKTYSKIYSKGRLIGVITDMDHFNQLMAERYVDYAADFPDTTLGLGEDVYIIEEKNFANFADVDEKIMEYLVEHDLLGVNTTAVEFSTADGIYEIIYVKDYEDFSNALERFLTNFVSEETIRKIRSAEKIEAPKELGTVEMSAMIEESISTKEAVVSPSSILKNEEEIYQFLCYWNNEEREYYTVREGDTLQGVGYYFGDMSPKQIVMLNPQKLKSETQVITPGMELNVTYFTSPINVDVTKQRLAQQYIVPEVPEYIEDNSLEVGIYEVRVQEESGIKNVLYEETWTNGVLQSGEALSETIIKQPKRGVIAVGTKQVIAVGTGNYVWPVDNPAISCSWGCYWGHTGTDFVNLYGKYTPVYAIDSGVVDAVGYAWDMGNFVVINHNNGVRTMYMHLNGRAYVDEGQNVFRGQTIGQMGNTGSSEGVHLHLTFEVYGVRVNACNYLPCNLLY